jgi:hypothetical protein
MVFLCLSSRDPVLFRVVAIFQKFGDCFVEHPLSRGQAVRSTRNDTIFIILVASFIVFYNHAIFFYSSTEPWLTLVVQGLFC